MTDKFYTYRVEAARLRAEKDAKREVYEKARDEEQSFNGNFRNVLLEDAADQVGRIIHGRQGEPLKIVGLWSYYTDRGGKRVDVVGARYASKIKNGWSKRHWHGYGFIFNHETREWVSPLTLGEEDDD